MLNYLLVPLLTYVFNKPSDFGINAEFFAYIAFLNVVLTYGLETALFNFSIREANKEKVYSTALISILTSTALFIVLICVFANPLAAFLGYSNNVEFVIWVGFIIATDAVTAIPFARLRQQNKAKRFALLKLTNIGVNIMVNVFFIGFCKYVYDHPQSNYYQFVVKLYNPRIGIGYAFLANLLANAVTLLLLFPEIVRVPFKFDKALWKRMIHYSLPILIVGLAGTANETLDRPLVKYLLPKSIAMEQLGIYSACYKIAIIMTVFIQAFKYAAEPFFFSQSEEKDAKATYALVMKYFVIACAFIFLATLLNLSWIKYFVHKNYWAGLNVVPVLLFANLCLGIFINLSFWYKITNKTYIGAYITAAGAIITLLLNFMWIPRYGFIGAAWATLICYATMMLLSYIVGNKHYPVNYELKRILGYLCLSLALYGLSTCINTSSTPLLLFINNLLLLLFVAVVIFIERRSQKRTPLN